MGGNHPKNYYEENVHSLKVRKGENDRVIPCVIVEFLPRTLTMCNYSPCRLMSALCTGMTRHLTRKVHRDVSNNNLAIESSLLNDWFLLLFLSLH